MAILCSTVGGLLGGKATPTDFPFPFLSRVEREPLSDEVMERKLDAMAMALGA